MSETNDNDRARGEDASDLSGAVQWSDDVAPDEWEDDDEGDEAVLACKLTGQGQARRRQKVVEPMLEAMVDVEEVDDGWALKFDAEPGVLRMLLAFVDVERQCCPFFRFAVRVAPDQGPIWLELGGSAEIKEALAERALLKGLV